MICVNRVILTGWVLVVAICFAETKNLCAADYQCDINGDNRLGLEEIVGYLRELSGMMEDGPNEVLDCGDPEYNIPESGIFSSKAKEYILCRVNEIRSEVALGMIGDDGTDGFYPIATNMQRMRWDNNLATVAQNYANKCVYQHNSNRNVDYAALTGLTNPPVGENIAAYGISWSIGPSEAVDAIEIAFGGWNGENNLWHYDTINTNSWASGFGHFTQHVWAETTHVGCGQAWCPEGYPNSSLNMIFTVCNFYISGNWWGEYIYEYGNTVCSEDILQGDTCENGLITPADYITGIAYDCDVNGDGELGIEEVIHALLILTENQ